MLAVSNGIPDDAGDFLDYITRQPNRSLLDVIDDRIAAKPCPEAIETLRSFLVEDQTVNWSEINTDNVIPMIPRLRRFLFTGSSNGV